MSKEMQALADEIMREKQERLEKMQERNKRSERRKNISILVLLIAVVALYVGATNYAFACDCPAGYLCHEGEFWPVGF